MLNWEILSLEILLQKLDHLGTVRLHTVFGNLEALFAYKNLCKEL